jgi:hypothetical protein
MKTAPESRRDTSLRELTDVIEALTNLFTHARELDSFDEDKLSGLRMGEVIRLATARRQLEQFKKRLSAEISSLREALDTALAAGESARLRAGDSELLQKTSSRSNAWRLQLQVYRNSTLLSQHDSANNSPWRPNGARQGKMNLGALR